MNIEIYPLEKVVIDGITIALGMEQAAVEMAIGKGELVGNRHYYFDSEILSGAADFRAGLSFLGYL